MPRLSVRDFNRLSRFIYDVCGIRLAPVKRTMLEARLQKRLRTLSLCSFSAYCDYLLKSDAGIAELVPMLDMVTTNKTDFFRESAHFDYLTGMVLPLWQQRHGVRSRPFAIWSAGCSSGEEPYTMAMVLEEHAQSHPGFDYRIMATDISSRVLETARLAVYREERIDAVPLVLRRRYFLRSRDRSSGMVRVVPHLRQKVNFGRLNFMDTDYGFQQQMDVVFCRNVLIYFDRPTQEVFLNRLCSHLAPGGHLFVGHSETLSGLDVPVTQVHPTIYRKVS